MALVHSNFPSTTPTPGATIVETTVRMSTTTTANGGSRLAQMQARFQQKQLQEKEQKLLRLYESQQQRAFQRVAARGSAGSSSVSSVSSNVSSNLGAGKVRQMFDERRTNGSTGWDRSYPLEPLDGSLNKSRSVPVTKTKASRVASLDRSQNIYNNNHQIVKRSKSQVRCGATTELNGSYRKQQNNSFETDINTSFRRLAVDQELNGAYRKVSNTESFRIQPEDDDLDDDYRKTINIDEFDGNDRKQDVNGSFRKQELNYEEEEEQFGGNETFTVIEDKKREDLFAKYQVRDVENNELLSASPPPELFNNDDELDDSYVFKKLPNVGGALLQEETIAPAKNSDKFKTYNASKQSKKVVPPASDVKKVAGTTRREAVSPPPKNTSKVAARKVERKVTSPPAGARRPTAASLNKQGSSPLPRTNTSSNTNMQKTPQKKLNVAASQPQRVPSATSSIRSGQSRRPGVGATAPPRDDLAECHICQRRFTADRIQTHESICQRTSRKKRKEYDATKHRVQGTEAEVYVKRTGKQRIEQPKQMPTKKDNWRKKHEDFILTIRAAKQAQAHIKAGGSVRDLPPPPPLDTSDYIQCPHCLRRFNEAAADRHIPRCATMIHNKPKPPPPGAQRGAVRKR